LISCVEQDEACTISLSIVQEFFKLPPKARIVSV